MVKPVTFCVTINKHSSSLLPETSEWTDFGYILYLQFPRKSAGRICFRSVRVKKEKNIAWYLKWYWSVSSQRASFWISSWLSDLQHIYLCREYGVTKCSFIHRLLLFFFPKEQLKWNTKSGHQVSSRVTKHNS